MKRRVAFRVDASSLMGSGHVARCLALAVGMRSENWDIAFFTKQNYTSKALILNSGFSCYEIPVEDGFYSDDLYLSWLKSSQEFDANKCADLFAVFRPDLIVVDHYGLDVQWEGVFHQATPIVVIDDLGNRTHLCDALVDSSTVDMNKYDNLISEASVRLLGVNYQLLRSEFRDLRPVAKKRRSNTTDVKTVVISFGSTDPLNYSLMVLQSLNNIDLELSIKVLISSGAVYISELRSYADRFNYISIVENPKSMAKEYLEADFAFGSASGVAFERACLGLPSACFLTAENQTDLVKQLKLANVCYLIFGTSELNTFLNDIFLPWTKKVDSKWHELSSLSFNFCDGNGVCNTIKQIKKIERLKPLVTLRKVTEDDCQLLFKWQGEPGARTFSRVPDAPAWSEHQHWFKQALKNTKIKIWVVMANDIDVGMVRLDDCEVDEEVSVLISSSGRGKGYGDRAIALLKCESNYGVLKAFVSPENHASLNVFKRNGYNYVGDNWFFWRNEKEGIHS